MNRRLAFALPQLAFSLLSMVSTVALTTPSAIADEGMWTFDNFPTAALKAKYNFDATPEWLDHVRLSSAHLGGGCSASFVSASGLVMTNHHCAHHCIEELSTAKNDLVRDGFLAKTLEAERKCPNMAVTKLLEISDVTARMNAALHGLSGQAFSEARKSEMSKIEKECAVNAETRCDVVTLYNGGRYNLYRNRRYDDVRLVFAPEFAIAFFGGDPDNFNFPRFDLDVSFLRVYDRDKPATMDHHFTWSASGAKEGELTFVSGTPGRTSRLQTIAKLLFLRDVWLPHRMVYLSELRGILTEFQNRGAEQKRISNGTLFYVENGLKAFKGRAGALLDREFMASKVAAEYALRAEVASSETRRKAYGGAWDEIAKAQEEYRTFFLAHNYLEGNGSQSWGFQSGLFALARMLVRSSEELPKPNDKRLREYTESKLPALKEGLFSAAPIYNEFEISMLTFSLTKLREHLGADHPFVKKTLDKESPRQLAERLVSGTKLKSVGARKALFEGGKSAIEASNDPMIAFVRSIDADARAIRQRYEDTVEAAETKNGELIARARFEIYGTNAYPDATSTARLNFGRVKGYEENGKTVAPLTTFGGAFDRHTGQAPFALPKSWVQAKGALDLSVPFNFASDNDIIGGNSGSPVINSKSEVVGLIFDGNIQSLGGDYGFDATVNRAVSVHSSALLQALRKIYGAHRVVEELMSTNK